VKITAAERSMSKVFGNGGASTVNNNPPLIWYERGEEAPDCWAGMGSESEKRLTYTLRGRGSGRSKRKQSNVGQWGVGSCVTHVGEEKIRQSTGYRLAGHRSRRLLPTLNHHPRKKVSTKQAKHNVVKCAKDKAAGRGGGRAFGAAIAEGLPGGGGFSGKGAPAARKKAWRR